MLDENVFVEIERSSSFDVEEESNLKRVFKAICFLTDFKNQFCAILMKPRCRNGEISTKNDFKYFNFFKFPFLLRFNANIYSNVILPVLSALLFEN